MLAGFDQTAAVFGQDSELQAAEAILMFEMAGLRRMHRFTGAGDAQAAYAAALREEPRLELDEAEQAIIDVLCNPTEHDGEDSGAVMAGAAWFVGAAFCPQIQRVQGMHRFTKKDDVYFRLAARFLMEPAAMADFEQSPDQSTRAAMAWFRTREALPVVLRRWRSDGKRRVRPGRPGDTNPPGKRRDEAVARRRKAAGEARRANHRKKS